MGVEVFRHVGVAFLAGGLLGVKRHFGTFNDDIVDFVLFPPAAKAERRLSRKRGGLTKLVLYQVKGGGVRDSPGGVELVVLGSRHQFRVDTNVFKHRLNGTGRTQKCTLVTGDDVE